MHKPVCDHYLFACTAPATTCVITFQPLERLETHNHFCDEHFKEFEIDKAKRMIILITPLSQENDNG